MVPSLFLPLHLPLQHDYASEETTNGHGKSLGQTQLADRRDHDCVLRTAWHAAASPCLQQQLFATSDGAANHTATTEHVFLPAANDAGSWATSDDASASGSRRPINNRHHANPEQLVKDLF